MCWKKNDAASIFSIAGMLLILIQCTYRFSLLMLKGQSLAHWAVLHKVEHLNDQKSTCMMSGQVNANKIIVMWGWASHNMQLYLHLLLMHVSSSMPAAAASMQNLTWLLSVVYVIRKQWDSLLHYIYVSWFSANFTTTNHARSSMVL